MVKSSTYIRRGVFAGAAAVVRHRSAILDRADLQTDGLKGADGGFATGARALDADFHFAHAVGHRLAGGVLRDLLRGERGALARSLETDASGAGPAEDVAVHIGDVYQGVVESREDIGNPNADIL